MNQQFEAFDTAPAPALPEPEWLRQPPTPEAFLWAARRGLGRAVWWLKRFDPTPYVPVIIELSTKWRGHDHQIDDDHAWYLVELAELSGHADEIAARTFDAALTNPTSTDACHVDDLMCEWAKRGRAGARAAIARGFVAEIAKGRSIGANAIIAIQGFDGLIEVARLIGASLAGQRDYSPVCWINNANETDNVTDCEERLRVLAKSDPQIDAFIRTLDAEHAHDDQRNAERAAEEAQRVSLDDICAAVQNPGLTVYERGRVAWRWWDWASEEEWREGARVFVESDDPALVWALQRPFRAGAHGTKFRPFPLPLDGLIGRISHQNEQIRWASRIVLAVQTGDEIAPAGRALLEVGDFGNDVICMLSDDLVPSDVNLVLRNVLRISVDDADEIHSVGLDVNSVCQANQQPWVQPLLRWVYENTPCAFCRSHAVEEMIALGTVPPEIAFEASLDSSLGTRRMISGKPREEDDPV